MSNQMLSLFCFIFVFVIQFFVSSLCVDCYMLFFIVKHYVLYELCFINKLLIDCSTDANQLKFLWLLKFNNTTVASKQPNVNISCHSCWEFISTMEVLSMTLSESTSPTCESWRLHLHQLQPYIYSLLSVNISVYLYCNLASESFCDPWLSK